MKVFLSPFFRNEDQGDGGIRRVVEKQLKYLPEYGVEFVKSKNEADIVNCHASSIEDHPTMVLSLHGLYWSNYEWPKWFHNINDLLIKGMKRAKTVTTPSEWVANSIRRGMLVDPFVVYHGIDINEWEPGENRGYVLWNKTRVDPVCDPFYVNALANLVPDIEFVSTFGTRTKNVELTNKIPFKAMKEYIRNAGVYLATTRETLGIGTLEAMACGVPILGWDYGGQTEIVKHLETGYLAPFGDYERLVEGLHYCLSERERLGYNARQDILDRWQWFQVIGGYYTAYLHALDQSKYPVKVSIVITAYDLEEYLSDAIESVINQPFTDWELIIVDDHSPDNCGLIAEQYAASDDRIKVIHNPKNVYLAEARNIGFRSAQGQYFLALDADDMLGEDALGRQVRALDQDLDLHIVTGRMELIEPDGRRWISKWPNEKTTVYEEQIKKRNQIPYASMYRREVWERTGGYRRRCRTAEDADFWTRAFSFGFFAKVVTNKPTLIYRNRPESMSHVEEEPDWTAWFTWKNDPDLVPFGVGGPVHIYGPPKISVVIPVGPKHEPYLQDCLDSLIGQTFKDWECILVNDTGKDLSTSPYLAGYPFVQIVDRQEEIEPQGTGWARNRGIQAATSNYIVFIDADDYMQPIMLETLYKAINQYEGWIYSDWFADNGEKIWHQKAEDWDGVQLTYRALGPITGIYKKEDLLSVGGFDEHIQGWEDWELHIKLLEKCICGLRVAHPLFTYRYRLGSNRERDFENRDDLLEYMVEKHPDIYKGQGEYTVACASCGKSSRPTLAVQSAKKTAQDQEIVWIKYVGEQAGARVIASSVPGQTYRFSKNEPNFQVYAADVQRLIARRDFELLENQPVEADTVSLTETEPQMVAERVVEAMPPEEVPLSVLDLDKELINLLKGAGIKTVSQLSMTSDAALLKIKGVGQKRLETIRAAHQ